jgi:hypothetical protein
MESSSNPIAGFVLLIVAFVAYFLPTFIASHRKHPNGTSIFLLDLFLGWTFIGWLAALIWSASAIKKNEPPPIAPVKADDKYQQLEKLGDLKDRGLLTDSEYQQEKARILG